jgi:hypothetical protein
LLRRKLAGAKRIEAVLKPEAAVALAETPGEAKVA